jgi:DNA helicase II / ATP-dependent DNA helicase PcrA
MPWNTGIDPTTPAYGIAADASPAIRVLAGPGTGKSFAIKRRITRLLEEEGVDPTRILAVTFTRMAAADLVRDIRSLEANGADRVVARTLHAECYRILARNDVIAITGRHPRALAAFETEPMLEDLREAAAGHDLSGIRDLVKAYESAWARLQHEDPGFAPSAEDQAFEDAMVQWLMFHRAILIGELIPFAFRYLRDNPAAPDRSRYEHVLVDEYQDLNKAEQEVTSLLAANGHLAVVGDDDQSIYTFKNAHRLGIIEFPDEHPGTHNHTMNVCQRCPALVVRMANALIGRNTTRPAPPRNLQVLPANGDGVVERFQFNHHELEMMYLATRIGEFLANGMPPGQIIVLCQARKYIKRLHDILVEREVPAQFCFQESQFEDEAATERMAILTLAGDPDDRIALRYLLGRGAANWRSPQWRRIRQISEAEGHSPWEVLETMSSGARPRTHCGSLVQRFEAVRDQIAALEGLQGTELCAAWLPNAEQYRDLSALAISIVAENAEIGADDLAEKIREFVLEPEVPAEVTEVRIMSLHKSKGLSANVVIIAGCVEGVLPRHPKADVSDAARAEVFEEGRRLFFVGITRVKASPATGRPGQLILSSSRDIPLAIAMQAQVRGPRQGGNIRAVTSQYMQNLGPACPAAVTP